MRRALNKNLSNVMHNRQSFLKLIIGLIIGFSVWQIYIMEQSIITSKHGILSVSQFEAQHHYQQEQQLNSSTRYDNNASILDRSTPSNGQNGNMTILTNPIDNSNYVTDSYLTNINYNISLTEDLQMDALNNSNLIINQKNETITTSTSNINNLNYFTNSYLTNNSYNLSLVNYLYSDVSYEALPKDDIGKLIDLHHFEYIINQKSCLEASSSSPLNVSIETDTNNSYSKQNIDPGSPLLLIFVPSAMRNYQQRMLIRETWGSFANTTNNIRLLFLLAAVKETNDQENLENENRIYSDIIQGNFIDHYKNLTYKHVMAFKWFTYYCPNAKYILKIDDDVFVNTPKMVNYLNTVADQHNLLFCTPKYESPVERGGTKWSVSKKEYYPDYYPTYCPGFSIVYSSDVAFRLYLEAQKSTYFWIDDVHVTGTLAQQANITITTSVEFAIYREYLENIFKGETDIEDNPFLYTWPNMMEEDVRKLWKLVQNSI